MMRGPSKPTSRRRKAPLRHGRRLAVETLESRTVLSAAFPAASAEMAGTVSAEMLRHFGGEDLGPAAVEVGSVVAASGRNAPAGPERRLGDIPPAAHPAASEARGAAGWFSAANGERLNSAFTVADLTRPADSGLPTAAATPRSILAAFDPGGIFQAERVRVPTAQPGLPAEWWDDDSGFYSAPSPLHAGMARDVRPARTGWRIGEPDLFVQLPALGSPLVVASTARRAEALPVDHLRNLSALSSVGTPVPRAGTFAYLAAAELDTFVTHVYAEWLPRDSFAAATGVNSSVLETQRRFETSSPGSPWQAGNANTAVDMDDLFAGVRPWTAVDAAQGGLVDIRLESPARTESSLFESGRDRFNDGSKQKSKVAEAPDSKRRDAERNADGDADRLPADERNRRVARRMIFETAPDKEGMPAAGRRADCREGGMIELAGGPFLAPEPGDGGASAFPVETGTIRMDAARGLFQAFELASGPSGRAASEREPGEEGPAAPPTATVSSGNRGDEPGERGVVGDESLEGNASRAVAVPLVLVVLPAAVRAARRRSEPGQKRNPVFSPTVSMRERG